MAAFDNKNETTEATTALLNQSFNWLKAIVTLDKNETA